MTKEYTQLTRAERQEIASAPCAVLAAVPSGGGCTAPTRPYCAKSVGILGLVVSGCVNLRRFALSGNSLCLYSMAESVLCGWCPGRGSNPHDLSVKGF